jgi:hypothetical protein
VAKPHRHFGPTGPLGQQASGNVKAPKRLPTAPRKAGSLEREIVPKPRPSEPKGSRAGSMSGETNRQVLTRLPGVMASPSVLNVKCSVTRGAGVRPKAKATGSLCRTRRISRLCPRGGLFEQPGEKSKRRTERSEKISYFLRLGA